MAVALDEAREVLDHVEREIVATARLKPEHGEVGIPIIDLAEAPARDHVRLRQREERRVRGAGSVRGLALKHGPQLVDMRADVLAGNGAILALLRALHDEVALNERGKVETGLTALVPIALHDD